MGAACSSCCCSNGSRSSSAIGDGSLQHKLLDEGEVGVDSKGTIVADAWLLEMQDGVRPASDPDPFCSLSMGDENDESDESSPSVRKTAWDLDENDQEEREEDDDEDEEDDEELGAQAEANAEASYCVDSPSGDEGSSSSRSLRSAMDSYGSVTGHRASSRSALFRESLDRDDENER